MEVVVAGAINWDINLFVEKFPQPGEETRVAKITRVPGGKAGNVAVAAAKLLGPKLVGIIGAVGKDSIGDTQVQLLNNEGVDTSAVIRKDDSESGQAYIVTDGSGENVIHTYFGANALLNPTDILNKKGEEMMRFAGITTIMDPPEATVDTITRIVHEAGGSIAWDPGIRATAGADRLRNMLLRANYLFLNELEVEYMTGVKDPAEAVRRLSSVNPKLIAIVKWGKEGCSMFNRQSETRIPGINLARHGLRVVNTVGCGDAFLGAFSAAKALGLADEEALHWANWAGALKAAKPDSRGSPTRSELEKWVGLTPAREDYGAPAEV